MKLEKEMCVYLFTHACLSVLVLQHVWEGEGTKEEGNYITNLPWLLMQFPSLLFSILMFDL